MNGNCWDRFGRKTLLTFTGYKDRVQPAIDQLERVGMQSVDIQWQFPNPFEEVLVRHLKHKRGIGVPGYMNCTMGHYSAVKRAYHLGIEHVLVMEDDIIFMNDTDFIESAVRALPEDFDVAMLDWFASSPGHPPDSVRKCIQERSKNEFWAEFDAVRSCGCYALSRRGMERYIWLNEAAVTEPSIGKMRVCDQFFERRFMGNDMHMYLAKINLAIQRDTKVHNSDFSLIAEAYKSMGIDVSNYGGVG